MPPGTVLAPGKDIHTQSQGAVVRPRGGYDHFSSPTHPAGLALVRPIPQQAAPIRVHYACTCTCMLRSNLICQIPVISYQLVHVFQA